MSNKRFVSATTERQRQELMLFWSRHGWKTAAGRDFLNHKYDIKVSEKTLYNLKKELRELYENRDKTPDAEVDWTDLERLRKLSNIPADAKELRAHLHNIWNLMQRHLITRRESVSNLIPPSYRRLKWWVYMEEQFKDKIPWIADRLYIADQLNLRDMLADWRQVEITKRDIECWLILKPWLSKEEMKEYLKLIDEGEIPPLSEPLLIEDTVDFLEGLIRTQVQNNAPNEESDDAILLGQAVTYIDMSMKLGRSGKYLLPSQRILESNDFIHNTKPEETSGEKEPRRDSSEEELLSQLAIVQSEIKDKEEQLLKIQVKLNNLGSP